jgi:hypothetical protein
MIWYVNWNAVSAIGEWISALATIVALFYAKKALNTWREQEKTKSKMDFKKSLMLVKNALLLMPDILSMEELAHARASIQAKWVFKNIEPIESVIQAGEGSIAEFERLLSAFENCSNCWVATEHLFDNSQIYDKWMDLNTYYQMYLGGKTSKNELFDSLNKLYSQRFVFNHK